MVSFSNCFCLAIMKHSGLYMVGCDCYATNLVKGNRTLGKSVGFSEYTQTQAINYTLCCAFVIFLIFHCSIAPKFPEFVYARLEIVSLPHN